MPNKMMPLLYKITPYVCLAVCSFMSSCSDDELVSEQDNGDCLSFAVSVESALSGDSRGADHSTQEHKVGNLEQSPLFLISNAGTAMDSTLFDAKPASRGVLVGNANLYDNFSLFAQIEKEGATSAYINNARVEKVGAAWSLSPVRYWPGADSRLRFTAYAPYDAGDQSFTGLTYAVPAEANNQHDLLVATADVAGDQKSPVDLQFRHICTAIRVRAAAGMEGTVTKVALRRVRCAGTFSVNSNDWSLSPATTDFELDTDIPLDPTAATDLATGENTFMMLPQALGDDARLEVTFADGTVLSGRLQPLVAWRQGTAITYTISPSAVEYVFDVTIDETLPWQGGRRMYKVTSYSVKPDGTRKAEPWTASLPDSEKVSWITEFTYAGEGLPNSAESNYWAASAAAPRTVDSHKERLREAATVNGVYDLSTNGGCDPMTTANCYIVNAPGLYTFPLVYGNAIKGGATNESAYFYPSANTNILSRFLNHNDQPITSPLIADGANAALCWEGVEGLVTVDATLSNRLVALDGETCSIPYVTFEVPAENIAQGSAMIAVRDADGTVLWSWHIWVTDFVPLLEPNIVSDYDFMVPRRDKEIYNHDGIRYTVMGTDIGWCDAPITAYDARKATALFCQTASQLRLERTLSQKGHMIVHSGRCLYYQFGRKDPLPGGVTTYTQNESLAFRCVPGAVTIGQAIRTPYTFHGAEFHDGPWRSGPSYINLWINENGAKTIYDPSPAGYKVAPGNTFTGFTSTGGMVWPSVSDLATINTPFTHYDQRTDYCGWLFYCRPMKASGERDTSGGVVYINYSGSRDQRTGELAMVNNGYGYHWTSLQQGDWPCVFSIYITKIIPWSTTGRACAYAIRPVRE